MRSSLFIGCICKYCKTNHDSRIAGSCFLKRVRPSNSDDSKGSRWYPLITKLVWMSAPSLIIRKLRRKLRSTVEGGNMGLLVGRSCFLSLL